MANRHESLGIISKAIAAGIAVTALVGLGNDSQPSSEPTTVLEAIAPQSQTNDFLGQTEALTIISPEYTFGFAAAPEAITYSSFTQSRAELPRNSAASGVLVRQSVTELLNLTSSLDADIDDDGLRNDVDKNIFKFDGTDVDGDKIYNYIDKNPYIVDLADVDYDGISNANDKYPYMPLGFTLSQISTLRCNVTNDRDCDQIYDYQDRFPDRSDRIDADSDGQENGYDKFPFIPFAYTSAIYDKGEIEYFCYQVEDQDCDGIVNTIDPDDYVAEFPDVDGDGIPNRIDTYPFYNPYLQGKTDNAVLEPSSRYHLPIVKDQTQGYIILKSINELFTRDTDNDGLRDWLDPYPYTRDWDNDGKPDGSDPQISVNEKKQEEKHLEEKRQEKKQEDKRIEEQRQEKKTEQKRQEEQRQQDQAEQKRQQEKRERDRQDQQRRDQQRQEQERQRQRDEQRRQQQG